jgi:hypothetical protein
MCPHTSLLGRKQPPPPPRLPPPPLSDRLGSSTRGTTPLGRRCSPSTPSAPAPPRLSHRGLLPSGSSRLTRRARLIPRNSRPRRQQTRRQAVWFRASTCRQHHGGGLDAADRSRQICHGAYVTEHIVPGQPSPQCFLAARAVAPCREFYHC